MSFLRAVFFTSVLILALGFVSGAYADRRALNPDEARAAVSRAQDDVRHASEFAHNRGKEQERFDNALHSLAQLDKSYSNDRYNKDRINDAIRDIKNVIDKNTIAAADRDTLNRDLEDLRLLRADRD